MKGSSRMRACRECYYVTRQLVCPNCGSDDLTTEFAGKVVIFSPDSQIAKFLGIKKIGSFALQVERRGIQEGRKNDFS